MSKQEARVWAGNFSSDLSSEALETRFAEFGAVESVKLITKNGFGCYAFIQFKDVRSAEEALSFGDLDINGMKVKVGPATPTEKRGRHDDIDNRRDRTDDRRRDDRYRDERRDDRRDDRRDSRREENRRDDKRDDRQREDRNDDRKETSRETSKREIRVQIKNLPADMTWQELKRLAEDFGRGIQYVKTWTDRGSVTGIVSVDDKRDAEAIIDALDGKRMEGCDERLKVAYESDDEDVVKRRRDQDTTNSRNTRRRVSRSPSGERRRR
jgi:RNA recognition motif-containing protein